MVNALAWKLLRWNPGPKIDQGLSMTRTVRVALRTLAFSLLAVTGFSAASAYAAPIYDYAFSPNASMTIAGEKIAISGTFGFDASTNSAVNLDITLTDTGTNASETFTAYSNVVGTVSSPQVLAFPGNNITGDYFGLGFGSSLNLDAVDPLVLTDSGSGVSSGCHCHALDSIDTTASAVTGSVVPVPEPVSFSLFGGGLIALGVARRRTRKTA